MRTKEKRPSMVRNLRNLFQRAQCTEQELRTLHGVVTALAGPRERRAPADPPPAKTKKAKRPVRRRPVKV
jgi:tRNA C32,U32 (ribose-2'-O)-methylase TrmJ